MKIFKNSDAKIFVRLSFRHAYFAFAAQPIPSPFLRESRGMHPVSEPAVRALTVSLVATAALMHGERE